MSAAASVISGHWARARHAAELDAAAVSSAADTLGHNIDRLAASFERELFGGRAPLHGVTFKTLMVARRLREAGRPRDDLTLVRRAPSWMGQARELDRHLFGRITIPRDVDCEELLLRTRNLLRTCARCLELGADWRTRAFPAVSVAFDVIVHLTVLANAVGEDSLAAGMAHCAGVALPVPEFLLLHRSRS